MIKKCKVLVGQPLTAKETPKKEAWQELLLRITGKDISVCPCCGIGKMVEKKILRPRCYSPPSETNTA
jgi:hypothetical protein